MKRQKVLAVDLGRRYIGTAYGFLGMSVAFPLHVHVISDLVVQDAVDILVKELADISSNMIVVGQPQRSSDQMFLKFRENVVKSLRSDGYIVEEIDESVSTIEAENRMADSGETDLKSRKDAIAAQILLERYFSSLS